MLHAPGKCGNVAAVSARSWAIGVGLVVTACGGQAPAPPQAPAAPPPAPVRAPAAPPELPVAARPDVDLEVPGSVVVRGGAPIVFDGVEEGLAWPALDRAVAPKRGDVLTVQVARGLPVIHLLRAAWTLRHADLHVQSLDASGAMHVVALGARRDAAGPVEGCHLAVFLRPDGALRVAAPGGRTDIGGDDPAATLARSLADQAARCPIKYVAFGAESDAAPWGPVFDVMLAVDTAKSAGRARYVLGQAMHAAKP